NSLISAINENYDDGNNNGFLECPDTTGPIGPSIMPEDVDAAVFPNPFVTATVIQFTPSHDAYAVVEIYSFSGTKVGTIFNNDVKAGMTYSALFESKELPDGIYFYKITAGGKIKFGNLMMIKE